MKKLLLAASAFVFSLTVMAQQKAEEVIKVNTEKYDFGKIKQGVPVTTFFEITNTSDKAVVVENAWGSCGCTTPEVPKEPIAPHSTTKLKVQYNAAAMGTFTKDVFIKLAGVQEPKNIKITGEVLDTAAYDAYAKESAKAKPAAAKKSKPGR
ncbi:DUF1573 domain-containing protein [Chitinophagaceae bacterium LB-8]|uniref:DUF1573 domain-containing protein n=1 Tax=Paraflavisolibacter caeni TaxID=2982496 RepID=A0A9X3BGS7_9BACT|nr:DUF1573 domain-containing protein [Paraflavisolibacter caeni]MCU7548287.1 DUF1573 domain-containing protein [Paraflavisolibacter caeni]